MPPKEFNVYEVVVQGEKGREILSIATDSVELAIAAAKRYGYDRIISCGLG